MVEAGQLSDEPRPSTRGTALLRLVWDFFFLLRCFISFVRGKGFFFCLACFPFLLCFPCQKNRVNA